MLQSSFGEAVIGEDQLELPVEIIKNGDPKKGDLKKEDLSGKGSFEEGWSRGVVEKRLMGWLFAEEEDVSKMEEERSELEWAFIELAAISGK